MISLVVAANMGVLLKAFTLPSLGMFGYPKNGRPMHDSL